MRRRTGAAAAVLLAAGALFPAGSASAVPPADHTVVTNPDPVNNTPHVLDGQVNAIEEIGDIVLVGGQFTQVQDALGGPVLNRTNLFAFNVTTGQILSSFAPSVPATVLDILSTGDGQTAWVSGQFNNINSASRTNRLARIDVTTGVTVPTFRSPGFNGIVKDLSLRNGLLYAAGTFSTAGPSARSLLTAVNPTTGDLSNAVDLSFTDPRGGGALQIIKFDITPDGSRLVAIGNFTKVNGLDRNQIAMIDLSVNPATVFDWQTTRFSTACSSSFDTYMRDIDISVDGSYFVVGTTGAYSGGVGSGTLCDAISQWPLGTRGPNQQPSWVDYTGGDTIWSVTAGGAAVYVGGHFRWFNNPFAGDRAGQGAVARDGIAALDRRNGLPLSWNPGRTRGIGAFELLSTNRGLWVGSDTDRLGNDEYHGRIALLPLSGGTALPDDFIGTLPSNVYSLGSGLTDAVLSRAFTGTSVTGSATVPGGGVAWNTSRGAFMVDGKLYTGQFNSTFTPGTLLVRSFDGTTFGTPSTVNLNGLTNFGNEIRTITGMFFDPATGRLYFTLSGANQLYYRYFTPESSIVGAVRFNGPGNLGDLSWSQVSSMFLADGHLYVASSADGNLRRYQWNSAAGTPVAGTATVVSGPGVDSQNWRARGAFVLAPVNGANLPPTASFTDSCASLQCTVDASASTDSDGTITSYAWDYGDGSTGAGVTAGHVYATPGTYTITLTVTDDDGATASTSDTVEVSAQTSQLAFRAAASADANSNQVAVTVPASVQAGDTLVMIATANASTVTFNAPTGVTGWTTQQAVTGNTMQTQVWSKQAAATDAGGTVRVPLSASAKMGVQVLAYSGSASASPVVSVVGAAETVTRATHTTPAVDVATAGSYVLSYWADKTSDTTSWTIPAGLSARATTVGSGSGRITSVSADPGSAAGVGPAGSLTATADSANSKAIMFSIVIAP